MEVYTKINTLYCRYQFDPKKVEVPNPKFNKMRNKIIIGNFADETFGYLKDNLFEAYSKIDGTNSKIVYYPLSETIKVGGKSDSAQSQHGQFDFLENVASRIHEDMKQMFPKDDFTMVPLLDGNGKVVIDDDNRVTMVEPEIYIYGEYYGEGIQKGGGYSKVNRFAVFDICVNGWWIPINMRHDICEKLELEEVPFVGLMTIAEAEEKVRKGFKTEVANVVNPDLIEEGLVLRPTVPLKTSRGKRIIVKVKYVDYKELDAVLDEFTPDEFAEFTDWYNKISGDKI